MRKNLSINSKRFIRTLSIGLSVYMALSPATALAAEVLEETPNDDVQAAAKTEEAAKDAAVEAAKEEAAQAVEAAQATANDENRAEFVETVKEQKVPSENEAPAEEAAAPVAENPVQEEINKIEEETIKEAVDNIVKVDMSNVDAALDKVSDLIEETVTDETVAEELVQVADQLIEIYDQQAETALEALKALDSTGEEDSIIVNEDGTVDVDWAGATEEIKALYQKYIDALGQKEAAEAAKSEAVEKELSAKTNKEEAEKELAKVENEWFGNNKEHNKTVAKSKDANNEIINQLIATNAAANKDKLAKNLTVDGKNGNGQQDIYRFFINRVEAGEAYGCLTYYEHESKTILRKNFKIDKEGNIDYTYVPKAEWVKNDPNSKEVVFGNGGNYIAAYVSSGSNSSTYFGTDGYFKGGNVSDLMRANMELNNAIDARNAAEEEKVEAEKEIDEIKEVLDQAESNLTIAKEKAEVALKKYNDTVAKYMKAASLSDEIRKNEVEKAKMEYVKAEVEAWKKEQILNQIDELINNGATDNVQTPSRVDELVENIAGNLGVAAQSVETLVVETIADMPEVILEEGNLNLSEQAIINEVRENAAPIADQQIVEIQEGEEEAGEEVLELEEVASQTEEEEIVLAQADDKEFVTIEEEETALAAALPTAEERAKMSWWWLLIVLICGATGYTWYRNHQKKIEGEDLEG